ncbi:MAG: GIY-YIG nuclease family protein [Oscillospiraceae bacterium]|nr:GIY-YIG nuclease family protein [Oscillospiraceae bacterium]
MYYVYILACEGGSFYSGITTDVRRRFRQHKGERKGGARYTKSHPPLGIAALWSAPDRASASRLEYYLHHTAREEKQKLFGRPIVLEKTGEAFEPEEVPDI